VEERAAVREPGIGRFLGQLLGGQRRDRLGPSPVAAKEDEPDDGNRRGEQDRRRDDPKYGRQPPAGHFGTTPLAGRHAPVSTAFRRRQNEAWDTSPTARLRPRPLSSV